MQLSIAYEFLPRTPTVRASCVMDHFGIGLEQGRHLIADDLELPIEPGQVVLFTGPSGSGKSSLLRSAAQALNVDSQVLDINGLSLGESLLIDRIPLEALEAMQLLAQCGLGEARLLLRRPSELSDGQQYRFRLALAIAQKPAWILADEFTATLDRTLARVIAFNVKRLTERTGAGFLLATTHEDVLEDLEPDVHVRCGLDGVFDIRKTNSLEFRLQAAQDRLKPELQPQGGPSGTNSQAPGLSGPPTRKKKRSASRPTSGSAKRPVATGRTSLGGITAAIRSP